jgi:hypothetical protein
MVTVTVTDMVTVTVTVMVTVTVTVMVTVTVTVMVTVTITVTQDKRAALRGNSLQTACRDCEYPTHTLSLLEILVFNHGHTVTDTQCLF